MDSAGRPVGALLYMAATSHAEIRTGPNGWNGGRAEDGTRAVLAPSCGRLAVCRNPWRKWSAPTAEVSMGRSVEQRAVTGKLQSEPCFPAPARPIRSASAGAGIEFSATEGDHFRCSSPCSHMRESKNLRIWGVHFRPSSLCCRVSAFNRDGRTHNHRPVERAVTEGRRSATCPLPPTRAAGLAAAGGGSGPSTNPGVQIRLSLPFPYVGDLDKSMIWGGHFRSSSLYWGVNGFPRDDRSDDDRAVERRVGREVEPAVGPLVAAISAARRPIPHRSADRRPADLPTYLRHPEVSA